MPNKLLSASVAVTMYRPFYRLRLHTHRAVIYSTHSKSEHFLRKGDYPSSYMATIIQLLINFASLPRI